MSAPVSSAAPAPAYPPGNSSFAGNDSNDGDEDILDEKPARRSRRNTKTAAALWKKAFGTLRVLRSFRATAERCDSQKGLRMKNRTRLRSPLWRISVRICSCVHVRACVPQSQTRMRPKGDGARRPCLTPTSVRQVEERRRWKWLRDALAWRRGWHL